MPGTKGVNFDFVRNLVRHNNLQRLARLFQALQF